MNTQQDTTNTPDLDLAYEAWCLIANVSEGDWAKQPIHWREAAFRWRDKFHAALDAAG